MAKSSTFTDTNQNFWQLASIQLSATSFPLAVLGGRLADLYGAGTAVASICLGNLLLWLIGLSIIAMSSGKRGHSIENVQEYLNKWGSTAVAVVLLVAFLLWIAIVLEVGSAIFSQVLTDFFPESVGIGRRAGVALGVLSALVATGGIRWIKWTCIGALPFLVSFFIWAKIGLEIVVPVSGTWGLSLPAVLTALAIALPGFVNLPTFFRHSRSKPDSFLALSLITTVFAFVEVSGIWIGDFYSYDKVDFYSMCLLGVTALSTICAILVNIYFASAGWETITPQTWRSKEYAIVGLFGTVIFVFIQLREWTTFMENLLTGFLGCVGVVLIAGFLVKLVVRHRPRRFEKAISGICWFAGCAVVFVVQKQEPTLSGPALMAGMATTAVSMLVLILIEETLWSCFQIFEQVWLRKN